jgi:hypothetical protein
LVYLASLGQRITSEIDEIDKRTAVFMKEMDKFSKLSELQDSAHAMRILLADMNDKHARGIKLLNDLLHASSSSPPQRINIRNSSEWRELQDLKSDLSSQAQDFSKLQESRTDYCKMKVECLQLMERINRSIISNIH